MYICEGDIKQTPLLIVHSDSEREKKRLTDTHTKTNGGQGFAHTEKEGETHTRRHTGTHKPGLSRPHVTRGGRDRSHTHTHRSITAAGCSYTHRTLILFIMYTNLRCLSPHQAKMLMSASRRTEQHTSFYDTFRRIWQQH